MSVLKVSGPVRRAMGANAAALAAGIGLPADAQCWQCGDTINLLAARPGSVTLSAVMASPLISVPTFGHAAHTASRVFTPAEFEAAATTRPSPIAGGDASTLLIEGRPADETVIVTGGGDPDDDDPQVVESQRARLLDLAAEIERAGGDEQALRIMQEATGLSMTDPEADRIELQLRVERAAQARANRAAGAKIYCVRCPSCAQLPDLVLSPGQAFCGNDDCEAFMFSPDMEAFEQLANRHEMPPIVGPGGIPPEMAAAAAAMRPVQVAGSAADDGREAEIRGLFHGWGYTCADGRHCAQCNPDPKGMNDGE